MEHVATQAVPPEDCRPGAHWNQIAHAQAGVSGCVLWGWCCCLAGSAWALTPSVTSGPLLMCTPGRLILCTRFFARLWPVLPHSAALQGAAAEHQPGRGAHTAAVAAVLDAAAFPTGSR